MPNSHEATDRSLGPILDFDFQSQRESGQENGRTVVPITHLPGCRMTNQIDQAQFQVVAELLQRQDEALEQLDLLSLQIEKAIEDHVPARENEDALETPAIETPAAGAPGSEEFAVNSSTPTAIS